MFEKHMGIVTFAKLCSDYEFGASESAVSFVKALSNAFTRTSFLYAFEIPSPRDQNMISALSLDVSQHSDKISKSNNTLVSLQ